MAEPADLRRRAGGVLAALTPHPHRGDLIAAGAAPLTLGVLLINVRLDARWGTGVFLVLDLLACALVLGMGVLAPLEGERPRPYQQVLQLAGLALAFVALLRLAQVFGVDHPLGSAGTDVWIFGILTGLAAWLAHARRSAICALVAALTGIVLTVSLINWIFAPSGSTTFRWVLLALAIGLVLAALGQRERRRRESVYLIDAAGIAILLIGFTYLNVLLHLIIPIFGGSAGPGGGWKLVLLAAGLGLIAYGAVDREPGPAYVGAANLLLFLILAGIPGAGGPSLLFWPLVLVLIGAALVAVGLRPRRPLPPEPSAGAPAEPVPGPGTEGKSPSLWGSRRGGGEQPS